MRIADFRLVRLTALVLVAGCTRPESRQVVVDSSVVGHESTGVAAKPDLIELNLPRTNTVVTSPLTVRGRARGPWFFEASFPVYLLDAAGDTLAATPAHADGEWMTTEFVPFTATLTFVPPAGGSGTLILEKSNASGLPEHDDELRVPVRFR